MPFFLLVFLFIAVPVAEISVLIRVGGAIGTFNTIAFVIFTAVLGAYLVRQQGLATLAKLQQETSAGRVPAMQIAEGVALLFAGAVLMTPGFITDAIGFSILIPPVRQALIAWAAKNFIKGNGSAVYGSSNSSVNPHVEQGDVIEGEYTVSDSQDKK
ncbi:MAG: FxsA family protein [Arenicella sp.]|nr:FxsA family protein [Arenicella sp.]